MSKIAHSPVQMPADRVTAPADTASEHRPWCHVAAHRKDLRQHGPDAQGCYSRDVEVTGRVGAWLIEGPEGAEVALDGPRVCLFVPAADLQALCGWLLELDPQEVQPAIARLAALVAKAAA